MKKFKVGMVGVGRATAYGHIFANHPDTEVVALCDMNQESLEHFIRNYGNTYRYLHFFHCQLIQDFSPLEDLEKLEAVSISWNIRAKNLWNFSKNSSLRMLRVSDAKQITLSPSLLSTSPTLEHICFHGSMFNNTPMESLDIFGQIPNLKSLQLSNIRLMNHSLDFLQQARNLSEFHFDAGMFTTEEIAWMVAKYPHLTGRCLKACSYENYDAPLNDVRICGFRKPSLDLPQHQKRLDKYITEFDALVDKFKSE